LGFIKEGWIRTMKLKKAKIIVESLEDTNDRWVAALKGKSRSTSKEETISVSSWEVLGWILSPARLQILSVIPALKPKSIAALAKAMKKDFKNVHTDVKFLASLGLIELREEGPRKTLVPVAKFDGIEFGLAA
jgi:predicted transcriptional regulator